jgi:opacity protein-like surface antigen
MSPRLSLLLAALVVLAPASHAAAQSRHVEPWQRRNAPFFALGGDAVYSSVRARASDPRIGDGYGFDVHATLGVSALALAGGYQRTEHDLSGTTSHATYSTVYAEPRVLLDLGAGNFTPYLAGRIGRTRVSSPSSLSADSRRLTGTTYAAGGGVQVWLVRSVALDLGAMWSRLDFGNVRTSARDVVRNGEDGLLLKAGVRLTP